MEESIYDILGHPIAYISFVNEPIFYMWNGLPVAYLFNDMIYGFNGKHLGWYCYGIVWNLDGHINGFNAMAADVLLKEAPFKGFKQFLPIKAFKELSRFRPFFVKIKSKVSLAQFLMRGRF